MINLAAPKKQNRSTVTLLALTHTHTPWHSHILSRILLHTHASKRSLSHTQIVYDMISQAESSHGASCSSFGLDTRVAALSRTQSPSSASRNPAQQGSLQRDTDLGENASGIEHPYLCVRAIFSLLFSDFRCASAGPAWEAFSSSVPLTLDAWGEDGVSHTGSWPKCISSRVTAQPYSGGRSGVHKACVLHGQDSAWSCDVLLTLHM